jgi:DNA-binding MarR family transcriptional regulator
MPVMKKLKQFGVYTGQTKYHEEIIYSMALIYGLVHQQISHYLQDYQLTLGKLNILIAIKHHGGEEGLRQVELSKHLIVTPSNMTKMIDKMEQEKLVVRFGLEGDRRVNMVKITTSANRLLDSLWPGFQQTMKQAVSGIPESKQVQLAGLLTEWFETLEH